MRVSWSAALLSLALAGCGAAPTPDATAPGPTSSTPIAAVEEDAARPADAGAITAIDAAAGDGRAMPQDDPGPSAYDLAQRAEHAREAERDAHDAPAAAPEASARLGTSSNLLGGDEAVTAGD